MPSFFSTHKRTSCKTSHRNTTINTTLDLGSDLNQYKPCVSSSPFESPAIYHSKRVHASVPTEHKSYGPLVSGTMTLVFQGNANQVYLMHVALHISGWIGSMTLKK
jgi:hypothetical protein